MDPNMSFKEEGITSDLKDKITEKLQKREEERLADIEKKKMEREDSSRKGTVDYFSKTFNLEVNQIEESLNNIKAVNASGVALPRTELVGKFDDCTIAVQKLQKFVGDYAAIIPSYDLQNSQHTALRLSSMIMKKREELIPKKKFTFSSRKKETSNNAKENNKKKVDHQNEKKDEGIAVENAKGFSDERGKDLSLSGDDIRLQDVSLQNLSSCKVQLKGYPSAVHINNLTNCKVFCGPVPGSIFVDNCKDCTFVVACQQLRVHHTNDTSFYLHVTSRAIIEDTTSVHFAPYNWSYPGQDEDYIKSGLETTRNNWDDVDDFNWLASDKHSPNWDIIPEENRVNAA